MEVGKLVAVIGDEDTVTGFLLAGVGHRTAEGANFLIVKQDTQLQQVEEAFTKLSGRNDIGIILINQHIANDIRHVLKDYNQTIPTVLEIPSKEHPYDPEQDYIMVRGKTSRKTLTNLQTLSFGILIIFPFLICLLYDISLWWWWI